MVSYIKTQWLRVIISFFCLLVAIHYMAQLAPDESTLEGVKLALQYRINTVAWLVLGLIWAVMSFIEWHEDCIRALEKRVQILENSAVTDIDKTGPNNYMVRRRLGPDKGVPYPDEEESKNGN